MNRLLQNRLLLQLMFTLMAAVSVAALSVLLITQAFHNAESVRLAETNQIVSTAVAELRRQYEDRVSSDGSWSSLPAAAKDVSLRGIAQTVLHSYPGVEGGFYSGSLFLGYAFPTHDSPSAKTDVPAAERDWILSVVNRSTGQTPAQQVFRGTTDLVFIEASGDHRTGAVAWAMKRLAGQNEPGIHQRELLLAALVLAALFSIVGTFATGIGLQRGVAQVKHGLSLLEHDFTYRMPSRSDELGSISQSINRMASVRRQLEAELRKEDRLRAVGRLASGIAHEIRNPLNSIRLTVQLLEHRAKTNSIRAADLAIVRSEVDRLNTLLTDLLDLQRSRQPNPQQQAVIPVLQHCITLIDRQAHLQGTKVTLNAADPTLSAFFDAQQLTQAVVNLLLNALEAAPGGERIEVRSSFTEEHVLIEVCDEGPGLGGEQAEHVFEAFYTTKPGGTGLGLAVSRELIRSQGGDLFYRSGYSGATFVIQLSAKTYVQLHSLSG